MPDLQLGRFGRCGTFRHEPPTAEGSLDFQKSDKQQELDIVLVARMMGVFFVSLCCSVVDGADGDTVGHFGFHLKAQAGDFLHR